MSEEPEFISQKLLKDYENITDWVNGESREMESKGATFFRASKHEEIDHLFLVEGWKKQPKDQGKPRFQFASLREIVSCSQQTK